VDRLRGLTGIADRIDDPPVSRGEKIVSQDAVQGLYAVFPADLLAFGVCPAVVGYGDLVNPASLSCNFGGQLRLDGFIERLVREVDEKGIENGDMKPNIS